MASPTPVATAPRAQVDSNTANNRNLDETTLVALQLPPAKEKKIIGPQPPVVKKEPEILSFAEGNTPAATEALEAELQAKVKKALKIVMAIDPEFKKIAEREDLKIMVVDNLRREVAAAFGQDVGPVDGVTLTPAILKGGKPPAVAQGNFVILQTSVLNDPTKSKEYNYANTVAIVLHEFYHLKQPNNPAKGEAIEKPIARVASEQDAFAKEIAQLSKLAESWKEKYPKYAAAMQEVIAKEKKVAASWNERR